MPSRPIGRPASYSIAFGAVAIMLCSGSAGAQSAPPAAVGADDSATTLRVSTKPIEPFVTYGESGPRGFSIDLWNEVADRLDIETEFVQRDTVPEVLEDVSGGTSDVAIAAISVTPEREQVVDFSYPYFDSGLQVLVRADGDGGAWQAVASVFSGEIVKPLIIFALIIVAIAHLLWLAERRDNPDFPRRYRKGIVESIWYSLVNVTTGGDAEKTLNRPLGRLFAAVWMVTGLFVVAYVTATVTANLTVGRLRSDIAGVEDLSGRRVAVVDATVAADVLDERGVDAIREDDLDAAFAALEQRRVDAVVHDAPALQYYASNKGRDRVVVVGPMFHPDKYAIALPADSPWAERVDVALLELASDGTIDRLRSTYFDTPG